MLIGYCAFSVKKSDGHTVLSILDPNDEGFASKIKTVIQFSDDKVRVFEKDHQTHKKRPDHWKKGLNGARPKWVKMVLDTQLQETVTQAQTVIEEGDDDAVENLAAASLGVSTGEVDNDQDLKATFNNIVAGLEEAGTPQQLTEAVAMAWYVRRPIPLFSPDALAVIHMAVDGLKVRSGCERDDSGAIREKLELEFLNPQGIFVPIFHYTSRASGSLSGRGGSRYEHEVEVNPDLYYHVNDVLRATHPIVVYLLYLILRYDIFQRSGIFSATWRGLREGELSEIFRSIFVNPSSVRHTLGLVKNLAHHLFAGSEGTDEILQFMKGMNEQKMMSLVHTLQTAVRDAECERDRHDCIDFAHLFNKVKNDECNFDVSGLDKFLWVKRGDAYSHLRGGISGRSKNQQYICNGTCPNPTAKWCKKGYYHCNNQATIMMRARGFPSENSLLTQFPNELITPDALQSGGCHPGSSRPGGFSSQPGGSGPQPGSFGSQPGSFGSQPGSFGSQHGSFGSQGGGRHPGGFPPQHWGFPPQHWGFPPQPGSFGSQHGGSGPQHGGFPPQGGSGPQHGGSGPQEVVSFLVKQTPWIPPEVSIPSNWEDYRQLWLPKGVARNERGPVPPTAIKYSTKDWDSASWAGYAGWVAKTQQNRQAFDNLSQEDQEAVVEACRQKFSNLVRSRAAHQMVAGQIAAKQTAAASPSPSDGEQGGRGANP
jgi:hypothetical protein